MYRKKIIWLLLLCFLFTLMCGCKISFSKKKPTNYYYTNLLGKSFSTEKIAKSVLLETNFLKEENIPGEDTKTINNLVKKLQVNNFIEKPKDLPEKPAFKVLLTFDESKYVINVYNDRYLSVFPWDGSYPMDYIDMNNIEISHNLYYICKYLSDN